MKTIKILLGAFLVTLMFAFTSVKDKAPQKVREAFAKKFPTVKKVKWEKENATEWEAEFKIDRVEYSANFLEDGTWQETEHEIDEKDVPQNVKTALTSAFPDYEIEEVELSETPQGLVYEFEIEKGKTEIKVAINSSGQIVKQEVNKENSEKEND